MEGQFGVSYFQNAQKTTPTPMMIDEVEEKEETKKSEFVNKGTLIWSYSSI